MKEMVEMYKQLNEEQRAKIFNAEQMACLDSLIFYKKLFSDKQFYNAVEKAIGEEAYFALKA
jgi:hypothetical protein